jgi:hypothetical protein
MFQSLNFDQIGMSMWTIRLRMYQMNPMNPFGGWWGIKKFFLMYGVPLWAFCGSSRFIGSFFGNFVLITINIFINISSLDVHNVSG